MEPPGPFFHLGTITGPQSECLIPHNAPNCSYNKQHSLVFSTCEGRWMRIENMAVLGDEERGPAPAVCSQRTRRRVIYKPQCPNHSAKRERERELSGVLGKHAVCLLSWLFCSVIWCLCPNAFLFIVIVKYTNKCVTNCSQTVLTVMSKLFV